jgi:hypothetical protein
LSPFQKGDHYYLPGFSALHEDLGKQIALKAGYSDPALHWKRYLVEAAARAQAEFTAMTGLVLDSPHGQNLLVELDKDFKPTGRIAIRDF